MPDDQQQFERIVLQRLRDLERRHARLRWLLVALLLAIGWRELIYRPVIRADRFELLDTKGDVRGLWRVRNDRPAFILRDTVGWRVEIGGNRNGGEVRVFGVEDQAQASLRARDSGATLQMLGGPAQSAEARIEAGPGGPRLILAPAQGSATLLPGLDPSQQLDPAQQ